MPAAVWGVDVLLVVAVAADCVPAVPGLPASAAAPPVAISVPLLEEADAGDEPPSPLTFVERVLGFSLLP